MSDFLMPSLGADMEAATLVEWLVKPGDRVTKGDIVAVVETQKGAIEVEIFDQGVVSELVAPVGTKVPVGGLLARIDGEAPLVRTMPPAPLAARPALPTGQAVSLPPLLQSRPGPPGAKVTPAARRRAAELGLDPVVLTGTGVDGSVTLADVELAAASPPRPAPVKPSAARAARFDPVAMRRAIADAMSRSKREIPHYYLSHTADLGPALAWLEAYNAARPVSERMLPAVMLLKAAALALRDVPQLNGTYTDGVFQPGDGVHVAWAIALRGGGLVAPVIRNADRLALPDAMRTVRDLVQRARTGGLRSSELSPSTITVTSLGDRGAEAVTGIIYPPQVAILGFGTIVTRPWVIDNRVAPRPIITITLAADHRASDGHTGGLLLNAIARLLQEPEAL